MRKPIFLISGLCALALLTGCSKDTADRYVGEQITSMKEKGSDTFASLLEEGIAKSNEEYVLQFPEELKEPYQEFLKDSFNAVTFEVSSAKKKDDKTFTVQVTYTPINVMKSTQAANSEYCNNLDSTDLTAVVTSILEEDSEILADSPVHDNEIITSLDVTKDGDKFSITDDSLKKFVEQTIIDYMDPYNQACDILDTYDFFNSYLNASFKGDVEQFALHTDRTVEEALQWYEEDVFDPPADLSSAYADRYKAALKTIMNQCQYTTGIPKKDATGYGYTIDVTTTPNNSLADAYHEFENGTYYSLDEASAGLVQAMEKYAAAPTFGEETTLSITINTSTLLSAGLQDSELSNMAATILVIP